MPFDWGLPITLQVPIWLLVGLAAVWTWVWKGIALWRAGRNGHLAWFIVMFIFQTLAILEIIYIFAFSKKERPAQGTVTEG